MAWAHALLPNDMAAGIKDTFRFQRHSGKGGGKPYVIGSMRIDSRVMSAAASDVRSLQYIDFQSALESIRPSVTKDSIVEFEAWSKKYSST